MKEKILIIDDEENVIELMQIHLISRGLEVISALNGKDGLSKAYEEKPVLIILDIRLPGLDGWEVCGRLKEDPETKHIPIIMLSAFTQKDDIDRSKDLGGDLFIAKPFDPVCLADTVEQMLGRRTK